MQRLENGLLLLRALVKRTGPYVLIELLLPGGTLFAIMMYLYRTGALTALQPMPMAVEPFTPPQVVMTRHIANGSDQRSTVLFQRAFHSGLS